MRERVHYDSDAQPNMGDDRTTSVWVEFTAEGGLKIDGYDYVSWPSRDYEWHVVVAADQSEALRRSLGAKSVEDILSVLVSRFPHESYGFWQRFSGWLDEHNIEYSHSSRWADN
ncbi:MAG: hypothetical protein R2763_01535 [Mycobacterium sp.]